MTSKTSSEEVEKEVHENVAFEMSGDDDHRRLELQQQKQQQQQQRRVSNSSNIGPDVHQQISEDDLFEDLEFEPNWITRLEDRFTLAKSKFLNQHISSSNMSLLVTLVVLVLYNVFFFGAVYKFVNASSSTDQTMDWCDGLGFLILITLTVYAALVYYKLLKPKARDFAGSRLGMRMRKGVVDPMMEKWRRVISHRHSTLASAVLLFAIVLIVLVVDSSDNRERLISGFGLLVLIFLGFVFSKHPGRIVWRHVLWGIALQFIFALVILKWSVGKSIFQCVGDKTTAFLAFTDHGSSFVYGPLVTQQPFWTSSLNQTSLAFHVATELNASKAFAWVFLFKILSVVYFFSFFISMLFYLGWMQWIVVTMGWMLQVTVGTTACESLAAAANVFLGQSEAPLMIRPYLPIMTNSELHAVMTGGFANIAGSVLAAYISFGVSASHLISASVMSAPGSLAMAKLFYPETKKTRTLPEDITVVKGPEANILDAATQGAATAVSLVANIAATLIAVLAFIGFINGILTWCGDLVGVPDLTFELILGKIFIPLAWLMGVPAQDLDNVGVLLGLKTFINEFVAYERMSKMGPSDLSPRARVIATYALCGFSNPASVGIAIAALGTMAPARRGDVSAMAFRSFVAGSTSCFLTACVAGMLIDE